MGILFSVIVPVFNSEKYISNTIKSVLRQPFLKEKYEIILINDHSSDNSKLIIQNFKKKFKNIKVINNKKNYKVSYCRNIGIKSAMGKYIIFLDSDDELKENTFNEVARVLKQSGYLIIIDHAQPINSNEKVEFFIGDQIDKLNIFMNEFKARKINFKINDSKIESNIWDVHDFATKIWSLGTEAQNLEMNETHVALNSNDLAKTLRNHNFDIKTNIFFNPISNLMKFYGMELISDNDWGRQLFIVAKIEKNNQ